MTQGEKSVFVTKKDGRSPDEAFIISRNFPACTGERTTVRQRGRPGRGQMEDATASLQQRVDVDLQPFFTHLGLSTQTTKVTRKLTLTRVTPLQDRVFTKQYYSYNILPPVQVITLRKQKTPFKLRAET